MSYDANDGQPDHQHYQCVYKKSIECVYAAEATGVASSSISSIFQLERERAFLVSWPKPRGSAPLPQSWPVGQWTIHLNEPAGRLYLLSTRRCLPCLVASAPLVVLSVVSCILWQFFLIVFYC